MSDPAALDGIRVLDLSSVGPAARCSRILADYGAEVIKVSPPPSKAGVQIEPPEWAYSGGRGMKRVRIDLKSDDGKSVFMLLVAGADVLIESFRPGAMERLGLGYEALAAANKGIVYCSTSGYGQTGPYADRAGHDLNYLAIAGFLHCTTPRADGGPPVPGATVADSAGGGMHAALAIMAALLARGGSGRGRYLDVSATEGVLSLMSLHIDEYLATGTRPGPGHDILTGRYAWYDCYRARDGKWLAVAAIEPAFWKNLCEALSLEKWIDHQRDEDAQQMIRNDLQEVFARRDRDEWATELGPADTCVAPVYAIDELVTDAHLQARGVIVRAQAPGGQELRQLAPVLAGSARVEGTTGLPAPAATDTDELLLAAGVASEQLARMRKAGVVA